MARSRRLGIAGEVSVWQIPENSVNHARVNTAATFWSATFWSATFWSARFWSATFFFCAQHFGRGVFLMGKTINDRFSNKKLCGKNFAARIWTGVFLIGKTIIGRFSKKKLLEQRPMIVFPRRSCVRPGFVRARRGRGFFPKRFLSWGLKTLFVSAGGG